MVTPEADLPLATPLCQRTLDLGAIGPEDAHDLSQNLSALAAHDGWLWLGGDEGRSLYRLRRLEPHNYGEASKVTLEALALAGDKEQGESDIEGLARDGQRLWLVGSHSLRLNEAGEAVAGQRLAFEASSGQDALTRVLADDHRLKPFLAIPSKENGLDVEGLTARDDRVLVGLRGPVLRGIALVVDLRLAGLEDENSPLTLASHRLRFLQLNGLAVRDLARVPESEDVLLLAGPTMTQAGPCYIYRWHEALKPGGDPNAGGVRVEAPEPLLWIREGHPGRPCLDPESPPGSDKPEGLDVQRHEDGLIAWVAYDDPLAVRRGDSGLLTRLDGICCLIEGSMTKGC
jgi:hypothetical protein